ncbi:hypothetical protein [Streptomyces sp. NPDC046985]|uniref:hypothetical protein n=1 Tax=Streptomyces sp. NPDC046985 TaxID=3155377 RepID=UPI0033F57FE3
MLALRLTRVARPAVQLRRCAVAAASAGTGFLLLSSLGHALSHPDDAHAALLRLSWCAAPLAATAYLAVAVARTDPGVRPRAALSALGLGPGRMMAVSAVTTALSCAFGTLLALLLFLHLRGDLAALPHGTAPGFTAAGKGLPVAGVLTLLATVPSIASAAVALTLRPREDRGGATARGGRTARPADGEPAPRPPAEQRAAEPDEARTGNAAVAVAVVERGDARTATTPDAPADGAADARDERAAREGDPHRPLPPHRAPTGLPWGVAVLAAGLCVEAYAGRAPGAPAGSAAALPGGLAADSAPVLVGWLLTALGLALAGPGLTYLCGRLLQAAGPGAVRLLAGRILMAEAGRIGRPLGVVCAVASGAYALTALHDDGGRSLLGPLTALGGVLVAGCTLGALLSAAVEARQARAGARDALRRLGAPASALRRAAALRAAALLVLFVPLTLVIADLAALPLVR